MRAAVLKQVESIDRTRPDHDISHELPALTPGEIAEQLRALMLSPDFQPPVLPTTALELVRLSRDPAVSMPRVRQLMEREPLIAAKVLSAAQSAFYSRGNPIESLEEALVRLGVVRLNALFMEAALHATVMNSHVFERPMERLRRHSVATGHIAREICAQLNQPTERAFLCGLLHDIGIAGAFLVLSTHSERLHREDLQAVEQAVRQVHEEASAIMGERWNLPFGIRWVVGHHHSMWVDGRISPLPALVTLSDWLATELGQDALGEANEAEARQAAEYFGFTDQALSVLKDRSEQILSQLA